MLVQLSSGEQLPEIAVKAWKRGQLWQLRPLAFFHLFVIDINFFLAYPVKPEVHFLTILYDDRAVYWACSG